MDRVTVIYDMDGTNVEKIEGYRVTIQLRPRGNAIIRVLDEDNQILEAHHYRKAYKITRIVGQ